MRPTDLPSTAQLAADKPHGTRIRYMGGCHCVPCRAANSRYECDRLLARKNGHWNGLVPSTAARKHLLKLASQGVGRRSVAAACDIGQSCLQEVKSGKKTHIRKETERKILAVTRDAVADHALVPAGRTWQRINHLLKEGFSKRQLAKRLGYAESLQFNKGKVLAANAVKVERFYRQIMAGSR